jgi:hypothetical protein
MAAAVCGGGLMVKFYMVVVELHKMEVWTPFYQKICMVFNFILQNDGPKPKFFWVK